MPAAGAGSGGARHVPLGLGLPSHAPRPACAHKRARSRPRKRLLRAAVRDLCACGEQRAAARTAPVSESKASVEALRVAHGRRAHTHSTATDVCRRLKVAVCGRRKAAGARAGARGVRAPRDKNQQGGFNSEADSALVETPAYAHCAVSTAHSRSTSGVVPPSWRAAAACRSAAASKQQRAGRDEEQVVGRAPTRLSMGCRCCCDGLTYSRLRHKQRV
jgi:hypothetical protein